MKVFYGAAIQGAKDRKERAVVHQHIISSIKTLGFSVVTEHTTGKTYEEAIKKLQDAIGPLPPKGIQRRIYVRNKMIEGIEGDVVAAVFEVSTPSLGTGIEIAHAYLRPRMGLSTIPILCLYQKDYWPNQLSTMIQGLHHDTVPQMTIVEYGSLDDIRNILRTFFREIVETKEKSSFTPTRERS